MKLYLSPGACSLADHIALHEARLDFDRVKVDLKAKKTEDGRDFLQINPKGYVPALEFDDGQVLTENIAILSWVTDQDSSLNPPGPMGRYRLLETLAYISSEIHKGFKPYFRPDAADPEKAEAAQVIGRRLALLAQGLRDDYLFGRTATVADAYLFVMCRWASMFGITMPDPLPAFVARMKARPAVRLAMEHEGLAEPAVS
jgi:glutathione S-transferase